MKKTKNKVVNSIAESESTKILQENGLVPEGFKVFDAPFVKAEKYVEVISAYDVNVQYVTITLSSIRGLSKAVIAVESSIFDEFASKFYK
jgi:hypothetical protein